MSTLDKNRLIGVAFLVVAFFHLATLGLDLFGFSVTYPYVTNNSDRSATRISEAAESPIPVESYPGGIPSMPGGMPGMKVSPTPAPPETKAQIEAKRTMTMIYVLVGVQFAIIVFVLFAGFTVVNVRAGGRTFGIVASLFLLFFYPLGTVVSIFAIWFLIGDECLELYSEVEKDKRAPQSII
ncbi:MAG TPA: hypothetical protein VGO50_15725 [Pyrinomonadaceae bacterium]|jgi:hypothetical protein|nr:hypothetical protein [Pyrinomonadaceae bacterium]